MSKRDLDFSKEYARNARLKPALLMALPVGLLASGFGLKSSVMLGVVFGPLAAAGFTYLLAHLTRDFGVRRQAELFRSWGGKPSVTKLRHRDTSLNQHTRARYHEKAAELLRRSMPTSVEEEADPRAADSLYEAYSNLLLERTRDTKAFSLLFEELVSYGFRRNLLGMKTLGLWLCFLCTLIEAGLLARALWITGHFEVSNAVFVGLDLFLSLCWWFVITPEWVRRAADAYAERLLASSETFPIAVKSSRASLTRTPKVNASRGKEKRRAAKGSEEFSA
jgi:hypothetical protein